MNKKETYNKGVETGLKVAQKVIEQEVEAMNYLKTRIDLIKDGHDEMKVAVNELIKDADENAIANIFGICNRFKPVDLKDHEKKMLINILATLSEVSLNERQKKYQNNLRHHLNLKGYEPEINYDFKNIESLESVQSIKIIAKAVRIFLYLKDLSMEGVYFYEDDLFLHFELRSFDEIDSMIEMIFFLFGEDGLIEIYGDYGDAGEFAQRDLRYLNVNEIDNIEISYECAQIYFKDCYFFDEDKKYIESSSYLIYNEDNKIIKLHKKTCIKVVLFDDIENASEFIEKRKIATFSDMGYYVLRNDLYFIDLETLDSGLIFHIDEEKNNDGGIYEVEGLCLYKSQKLIYRNGCNYIVDLEKGMESAKTFSIGSFSEYTLRGDYIYFLDTEIDIDFFDNPDYVVERYGILNDHKTTVSKKFRHHKRYDFYYLTKCGFCELISQGMYDQYYYCVLAYQDFMDSDQYGFECFIIDTQNDELADAKKICIENFGLYQIEQYKNTLIFVSADKSYSLVSYNFLSGKKKVLKKNYGKTEKSSFSERRLWGKSEFQHPAKYMRLGKWVWINYEDEVTSEIIPL